MRADEIHTGDEILQAGAKKLVVSRLVDVDSLVWLGWYQGIATEITRHPFRPEDQIERVLEGPVSKRLKKLKADG